MNSIEMLCEILDFLERYDYLIPNPKYVPYCEKLVEEGIFYKEIVNTHPTYKVKYDKA